MYRAVPFALMLLVSCLAVSCGMGGRPAPLAEVADHWVLSISGPYPGLPGEGPRVWVEVEPPEESAAAWEVERSECPSFDVQATVNGHETADMELGGWVGGRCRPRIDLDAPWDEAYRDRVEVRVRDESATLVALYEKPGAPSIAVSPEEAAPGDWLDVAMQPPPYVEGSEAEVFFFPPGRSPPAYGPRYDVVEGAMRVEVPTREPGPIVLRVTSGLWMDPLVACEGFARCNGPYGFMNEDSHAETSILIR